MSRLSRFDPENHGGGYGVPSSAPILSGAEAAPQRSPSPSKAMAPGPQTHADSPVSGGRVRGPIVHHRRHSRPHERLLDVLWALHLYVADDGPKSGERLMPYVAGFIATLFVLAVVWQLWVRFGGLR